MRNVSVLERGRLYHDDHGDRRELVLVILGYQCGTYPIKISHVSPIWFADLLPLKGIEYCGRLIGWCLMITLFSAG